MVEEKKQIKERIYVINLRREWLKVPRYERTGRAIKAIKKFIAKHMKVRDKDFSKIKLDSYLNNEIWFRGRANPPAKIKVKAIKEGEIVKVDFVEEPSHIKFLKSRSEKIHKEEIKKSEKEQKPEETKKEELSEKRKQEEIEKEKAVSEKKTEEIEQNFKIDKHLTKVKKATRQQRMALEK